MFHGDSNGLPGFFLDCHPKYLVGDEDLVVADLGLQHYRASYNGSMAPLPYSGGALEQPAALTAAIRHCASVASALAEARRDHGEEAGDPRMERLRQAEERVRARRGDQGSGVGP